MLAIGMIETKGLLPAIEASDVMLKAAEVHLLERNFVGSGLVCIVIEGDVAAVQASVDAAAAAVEALGRALLVSSHVIPRPDRELEGLFNPLPGADEQAPEDPDGPDDDPDTPPTPPEKDVTSETVAETAPEPLVEAIEPARPVVDDSPDASILRKRLDETLKQALASPLNDKHKFDALADVGEKSDLQARLNAMRVVELRSLAREYEPFTLQGRNISRANKEQLLDAFNRHYDL